MALFFVRGFGRHAEPLFENFREVRGGAESAFQAHLRYGHGGGRKEHKRIIKAHVAQVFVERYAKLGFK